MNWKIRQLIQHMHLYDECDEYAIYIPNDGQVIIAYDPTEEMRPYQRRHVEQVELHNDEAFPYVISMQNDFDDPIHDVTDIKFEVHEAVVTIG